MTTAESWSFRRPSVIPGFGVTLGFALTYLSLIVLIPLAALIVRSASLGWSEFWHLALDPRTLAALRVSFTTALIAAIVNSVFGLVLAWVLVRYRLPGKRLVDSMIDLPFALPTAVAGIALSTLYAPNAWIGGLLAPYDIKIAYTPAGIVMALIFIGLPFVERTVLPELVPAILTGFALALARGIGEYGSVVFIAGNIPFVSEIAPLLIVIRLEEFNYRAATAVETQK